MNLAVLIGRLCADPEIRYITGENQIAVCRFALAVDRPVKQGQEKKADFPRIVVFGRQAENCERYLFKGSKVGVQGRIQTGSYKNKDGQTVYTTDVVADRVEFLEWGDKNERTGGGQSQDYQQNGGYQNNPTDSGRDEGIPEGFQAIPDDDIPF